jgi:DNA repair protein RadC
MNDKAKFWNDLTSGRFATMVKESSKGQSLSNSLQAYHVLKPLFAEEDDVEKVYFIFLDAQNKILGIESLFSGTIQSCFISPREVVKRLIAKKAAAFVMGHNHPSGDIVPSPEDRSISIKVGIAAASIDVQFHDHLIVGDGYHSMADSGWLKNVTRQFSNLLKSEPSMKGETS